MAAQVLVVLLFIFVAIPARAEVGTGSGSRGSCAACGHEAPGNCTLPKDMEHKAEQNCFASNLNNEVKKNKGEKSERECLKEVRSAFERAANLRNSGWCMNASDSGKCLRDFGMVPVWTTEKENRYPNPPAPTISRKDLKNWSVSWPVGRNTVKINGRECLLPERLPPGTTLVYGGTNGGVGHVEVFTDEGIVCSDFCSTQMISERTRDRWVIGIYLPPPAAYGKGCQGALDNPWLQCQ